MDSQTAGGDKRVRLATEPAEEKKSAASRPHAAELVLRHKGVSIVLQFSEEPTREAFEYLARYCTFEQDNYPVSEGQKVRKMPPDDFEEASTQPPKSKRGATGAAFLFRPASAGPLPLPKTLGFAPIDQW